MLHAPRDALGSRSASKQSKCTTLPPSARTCRQALIPLPPVKGKAVGCCWDCFRAQFGMVDAKPVCCALPKVGFSRDRMEWRVSRVKTVQDRSHGRKRVQGSVLADLSYDALLRRNLVEPPWLPDEGDQCAAPEQVVGHCSILADAASGIALPRWVRDPAELRTSEKASSYTPLWRYAVHPGGA
jgi:hypothetical protein